MSEYLDSLFSLHGRSAVVTGAGTGLGQHIALTLGRVGAQVALLGRRAEPLHETAQMIQRAGGNARVFAVDVEDRASAQAVLTCIEEEMNPPWLLVNNAGRGGRSPLLTLETRRYDEVFSVNVKAALYTATDFAQMLVRRESAGRIINICSLAAQTHSKGLGLYGASKAALEHLTLSMAHEWAPHGINVNAINPGFIETDINRALFQSEAGQRMVQALPRQRLATAASLEGAVLLMASPAAPHITGATLVVDDAQRFTLS